MSDDGGSATDMLADWMIAAWVVHLRDEHGLTVESPGPLPVPVGSCTCVNGKGGHLVDR